MGSGLGGEKKDEERRNKNPQWGGKKDHFEGKPEALFLRKGAKWRCTGT